MQQFWGWVRKSAFVIIAVALVYSWFFATHQKVPTTLKVLGANTNINLTIEPNDGRDPIVQSLAEARSEVLVESYLLSDKTVISALEDAKSRGLTVEVMLEQHPFGGGDVNTKTVPELQSDGIAFKWTNPTFTLTHEKAIIIDDSSVWVLSQNLTTSAFDKNREYDVLDTDTVDVAEARNIFVSDWNRQNFTPSTDTNLIVSPVTSRPALVGLLQDATKSISIEVEDIDDPQIIGLLAEKAKSMPVLLLTPTIKQLAGNARAFQALSGTGVEIKTISSPYMHAKLVLVDGSKAYIGSVNLSRQSLDENRELGIILTEGASLESLGNTFASDWNQGLCYNSCTDSNL